MKYLPFLFLVVLCVGLNKDTGAKNKDLSDFKMNAAGDSFYVEEIKNYMSDTGEVHSIKRKWYTIKNGKIKHAVTKNGWVETVPETLIYHFGGS